MEQPPEFIARGVREGVQTKEVVWFRRFGSVVVRFGMQRSVYDHTVLYKHANYGYVLLIMHVNDIVITGSDARGIDA